MGSASSKPQEDTKTAAKVLEQAPRAGGCPVKHEKTPAPGCPVQHKQYNVYSQPIDPKNQTPAVANQLPSPGQTKELSTERIQSTIPKGGAEEGTTWTYPSPQMFYNALSRKQKLGDTSEEDIDSVVALHNNMNECTWSKVLEWEQLACPSSQPKLLKFMGRPTDLSPKARFKHYVLGHPLPFDRHDWTIVREDGTTVRYVIDYYHDESRDPESGLPELHDKEGTPSLLVDVRPALDGPTAMYERVVRMPYARRVAHSTDFDPLAMMPTKEMKSQVLESIQVWDSIQKSKKQQTPAEEAEVSHDEAVAIAKAFGQMLHECQDAQVKVNECQTEQECARASMDLTLCMAKVLCPLQHSAVVQALQESEENQQEYDARLEKSLEVMSDCVAGVSQRAQLAQMAHPDAFE